MDKEIINLAIRNNFYVADIWFVLYKFVYPPKMKEYLGDARKGSRIYNEIFIKNTQAWFNGFKFDKMEYNWFVLKINNKPVGFWLSCWRKDRDNQFSCLEFLLVDKNERRKGYGKMLLENYFAFAEANNRDKCIVIQFDKTKDHLKDFYSQYGFVRDEEEEKKETDWKITDDVIWWYRKK